MTQAELARQLGVTPAAVTKLKKRGMPVDDLEAARRWRTANVGTYVRSVAPAVAPAVAPVPAPTPAGGVLLDLATERALLTRSQREAQDMKTAILRGQYAPISYLSEVLASVCAEFAQRLDALPAHLRRTCPDVPASVLDELGVAVAAARNSLADAVAQAAERAATNTPFVEPTPQ